MKRFFRNCIRFLINNMFNILGLFFTFVMPLTMIIEDYNQFKPSAWGLSLTGFILLFAYLIFFLKFAKGFITRKIGSLEAVNEINGKHTLYILLLYLWYYSSYFVGIWLFYYAFELINKISIGVLKFTQAWMFFTAIGLVCFYIDKARHITKKGILDYESKRVDSKIKEDVESEKQK